MTSKIAMYLYFAYGSNLLASRMFVQNPTAKRVGPACLQDHRLDFNFESTRWGGHAATIVPDKGKHVWGALWQVDNITNLDLQEGVNDGIYFAKQVFVNKFDNETVECRTYQLVQLPKEDDKKMPSRVYLETIIQGAVETGLPVEYINELKKIRHNGFEGPIKIPGFNISFVQTTS